MSLVMCVVVVAVVGLVVVSAPRLLLLLLLLGVIISTYQREVCCDPVTTAQGSVRLRGSDDSVAFYAFLGPVRAAAARVVELV